VQALNLIKRFASQGFKAAAETMAIRETKMTAGLKTINYMAAALIIMTASASWAQTPPSSSGPVYGGGANSANSTAQGTAVSVGTANAKNQNSVASGATGGQITTFAGASDPSKAIPNVYSPALAAAGYEVCLGSMSAGGSASGFGVTFGGTYEDKGCQARLNAKTLATLGYTAAAREIMCQNPNIRSAMRHAGTPCAGDTGVAAAGGACRQEYNPFSGWEEVCGP
jgi:hypothetical protein